MFGRVAGATAARELLRGTQARAAASAAPATAARAAAPASGGGAAVAIAPEQVAKHASESDCWVTINGKVYDVTKARSERAGARATGRACLPANAESPPPPPQFLPDHPGGKKAILLYAGRDASEEFNMARWLTRFNTRLRSSL